MSKPRLPPALLANLALAGAPLYWWQGRRVRTATPRLPEAPGPRRGVCGHGGETLRLLGIGESPLAGVGLDFQAEALIPKLAEKLAAATGSGVFWKTAARSGATAADARNELLAHAGEEPVEIVIVALGVNDCLQLHSARRWRDDLSALIDALEQRTAPLVTVLAGVPPMQHFPALPQPLATMLGLRARLLDAVCADLSRERANLIHVPMAFDGRADELFCRDGFHPCAHAHQRWAEQLAPDVLSVLAPHLSA